MGKDSNSKHHVLVVQTSHLSVGIFKKENSQVVSEYSKMILIPLTFIVDSTINLMSGLYHECEKMKHYSLCSKNYSFRNRDNMCMSHTPLALSCLPLLFFFFFFFFWLLFLLLVITCSYFVWLGGASLHSITTALIFLFLDISHSTSFRS